MVLTYDAYGETLEEQKKKDNLLEQMRQQQLQYQHKIEEFEDRDKKEKEELREGLAETMKMIRILVTEEDDDDTRAKHKAYHLTPEDTETKEGIKASSTRAFKQLKEDTLSAAHSSYYKQQRRQQQQRQRRHRMKNN